MKLYIIDNIDSGKQFSAVYDIKKVLQNLPIIPDLKIESFLINSPNLDIKKILQADRIILSGSVHSAYNKIEWSKKLEKLFKEILNNQIPALAVCFSAQFLAQMLGTKVEKNPKGRELGAVKINLTTEGQNNKLLNHLHKKYVIESHKDYITKLPTGTKLLAHNTNTRIQAFNYKNILATQFHPDMPLTTIKKILNVRKKQLEKENFLNKTNTKEKIMETTKKATKSYTLLTKFLTKTL